MIGFENAINIREQIIRNNISIIKSKEKIIWVIKLLTQKKKLKSKKILLLKESLSLTKIKVVIYEGVRLSLEDAYLKIYGGFKSSRK